MLDTVHISALHHGSHLSLAHLGVRDFKFAVLL